MEGLPYAELAAGADCHAHPPHHRWSECIRPRSAGGLHLPEDRVVKIAERHYRVVEAAAIGTGELQAYRSAEDLP